ncbi:MAG: tRNA dihydrouridine(20/20a) synthase DusA [Boseongicola sp. SB0664_bin_43]|uniref:tRNA-dihydrouridine(20/20a) synthase n=1 Tax=Boseongicola sp. SB0664_bin_43 TaxID=2604844 RepID=A0A6B0XY89_9RHOB|nr:tRNA dihydrouridine(20/20a) synthase DusA [Boseongicola sp. SB0664_bin_43]
MGMIQHSRLSVAPMMDWTDRHCRYLHRLMSRRARLYTEMVTSAALVRGNARHLIAFDEAERPLALQLGGSGPAELAEAARIAAAEGYDEVNLNVGCPSERVQSGTFGAVLMKRPELVAECLAAMRSAVTIPVTVKCRIGVDDQDPAVALPDFLQRVRDVGVTTVAVHARKAWLQGLNPKQNREIPPLDHDLVCEMKDRFPDLRIISNGGIASLEQARVLLGRGMDGVMIGRAAYQSPWRILGTADLDIFGERPPFLSPVEVVRAMCPYIERHVGDGGRLHAVTRHMLGLFAGRAGARRWRRCLSEHVREDGAGVDVVLEALEAVVQSAEDGDMNVGRAA